MQAAAAFLEALVEAVPYRIHTVLTDNGIQFADLPKNRGGLTAKMAWTSLRSHLFSLWHWPPSDPTQPSDRSNGSSSQPTTSLGDSRPFWASHPTKPSANSGPATQTDLHTTQSAKCRD
jgi:hypothetical protein